MPAYNEYEERLVERIAVREASAALQARDRRVICRYYRHGDTREEIAGREGISTERVRQIESRALQAMQATLARRGNLPLPMPLQMAVPLEFDRAAFLGHMRRLIEIRDRGQSVEFECERRGLAEMLAGERRRYAEDAAPSLKIKLPVQYTTAPKSAPLTWGIPSKPPPPDQQRLQEIARIALGLFLADRPAQPGLPVLGLMASRVVYPHDGGQCEVAVQHLRREVPAGVHFSAVPLDVPLGTKGAVWIRPDGALRATLSPDGATILLDVTWDAA